MKSWTFLLFAVLFALAVPVLIAVDPDGFSVAQLYDFGHVHHEWLEVLAAVLSTVFFAAYYRKGRKENRA